MADIRAEGFEILDEFRAVWIIINGNWNPNLVVTAYEVQLVKKGETPQ